MALARIELNDEERKLFATLLEVRNANGFSTVLRVAGGWVRDKLLGQHNDDVDIALSDMLGREFAECVQKHLTAAGEDVGRVGVVQANPDQSKHLETATLMVRGHWIDFTNLRHEQYSDNSRIPEMRIGTPKEDAHRRDFTINSLFYNINENKVEDFTGRGLRDLQDRVLRTPLPPLATFLDDPLRVLRAVRFAARFDLKVTGEVVAAATDSTVHSALQFKVSKERVGKEFMGMLDGRNPLHAFELLAKFNVADIVFALPPSPSRPPPPQPAFAHAVATHNAVVREWAGWEDELGVDAGQRKGLWVAAYLLPVRGVTYKARGVRPAVASTFVIKESLKLPNHLASFVQHVHEHAPTAQRLAAALARNDNPSRSALGGFVREGKGEWQCALLVAAVLDRLEDGHADVVGKYRALVARVRDLDLLNVHHLKPFVTGQELTRLTGVEGKDFADVIKAQLEWQMDHPHATKHECEAWLVRQFGSK